MPPSVLCAARSCADAAGRAANGKRALEGEGLAAVDAVALALAETPGLVHPRDELGVAAARQVKMEKVRGPLLGLRVKALCCHAPSGIRTRATALKGP